MKTGPIDYADWNYRFVLGHIERRRFQLIRGLLLKERPSRLLEVGYGSGVLMPELARHCSELYGIDVHAKTHAVATALQRIGVRPRLVQGCVTRLPFAAEFFDCVVCVSVLEFIEDLDKCCQEVCRVLKPGGHFLVVTPGKSLLVDLGFRLLSGKRSKGFGSRRQRVQPTLRRHFHVLRYRTYPRLKLPGGILYHSFKLTHKPVPGS